MDKSKLFTGVFCVGLFGFFFQCCVNRFNVPLCYPTSMKEAERCLSDWRLGSLQAGIAAGPAGGLGGMDIGALLSNPHLMNMVSINPSFPSHGLH